MKVCTHHPNCPPTSENMPEFFSWVHQHTSYTYARLLWKIWLMDRHRYKKGEFVHKYNQSLFNFLDLYHAEFIGLVHSHKGRDHVRRRLLLANNSIGI